MQLGPEMRPYIAHMLPRLIQVMNHENVLNPVLENASIAIGRLALSCPEDIAPELPTFAGPFLRALKDAKDNLEKDSAFRGFCTMIALSPNGILNHLTDFIVAIGNYNEPTPELRDMFRQVFHFSASYILTI